MESGKEDDGCMRVIKTIAILMFELAYGLLNAIYGPVLLDLMTQVKADLQTIVYVVTARGAGHAAGCLICESS